VCDAVVALPNCSITPYVSYHALVWVATYRWSRIKGAPILPPMVCSKGNTSKEWVKREKGKQKHLVVSNFAPFSVLLLSLT
jgi:hypothetical protein